MVKHTVLWKFRPEVRAEACEKLRAAFESLRGRIPGLLSLEARANENAAETTVDFSLRTEHATWKDLEVYQKHPKHLEIVGYVRSVATERRAIDYEV